MSLSGRYSVLAVVALLSAAMFGVSCGQYVGIHQESIQARAAAAVSSPSHPTGPEVDQPDPNGPGLIIGNSSGGGAFSTAPTSTKNASGHPAGAGRKGLGARGKGGSRTANGKKGGQTKPAGGSVRPRAGKATGSKGASTAAAVSAGRISKIVRRDAKHNQTVLPQGFPFLICPVQGQFSYSDDFGAPRCTSGDASCGGFHLHAGNDILAALGTPIVAPFDGRAVNSTNSVGGNAVSVYGAQGHVYNAHLVEFGQLGPVRAGTVIGFVGNTGDAAGGPTHDHFEWHPNSITGPLWGSAYGQSQISGAIDPYPYLRVVCPPGA